MTNAKSSHASLKKIKPSGKKDADFFSQVYEVVRLIPKGRVTSYGAIARALGTKLSARMVGWAMNNGHNVKPRIPAHRVLNREGMLTGKMHFGAASKMQELLEKEGIKIENDRVVDLGKHFWDPASELSMGI
jgi:methylated-DNA-protein-cysteine methyltransferase-like protein